MVLEEIESIEIFLDSKQLLGKVAQNQSIHFWEKLRKTNLSTFGKSL